MWGFSVLDRIDDVVVELIGLLRVIPGCKNEREKSRSYLYHYSNLDGGVHLSLAVQEFQLQPISEPTYPFCFCFQVRIWIAGGFHCCHLGDVAIFSIQRSGHGSTSHSDYGSVRSCSSLRSHAKWNTSKKKVIHFGTRIDYQ